MSKKTIILTTILFALIVAGMFIFAFMKKSELENVQPTPPENVEKEEKDYGINRIDAKHFFVEGTHTIIGSMVMPTPCDLLNAEVVVMESYPEQVRIDINVVNNSEFCAQVTSEQRFRVDFTASEEAVISAYLMGELVELNLIPASPGETPENPELFFKG